MIIEFLKEHYLVLAGVGVFLIFVIAIITKISKKKKKSKKPTVKSSKRVWTKEEIAFHEKKSYLEYRIRQSKRLLGG